MTGIYQVSNYTPCQIGLVKGERGENGANGANGLNGKDGKDGKDGLRGLSGSDGKSNYQLALDSGFIGSLDDYLLSMKCDAEGVISQELSDLSLEVDAQKLDTGITATAKFGGIERELSDKNTDYITPKDFGARGNTESDLLGLSIIGLDTGGVIHTDNRSFTVAESAATDYDAITAGGAKLYINKEPTSFETRAEFVQAVTNGLKIKKSTIIQAGNVSYIYDKTSTEILDLPSFKPFGEVEFEHYGGAEKRAEPTRAVVKHYRQDENTILDVVRIINPKPDTFTIKTHLEFDETTGHSPRKSLREIARDNNVNGLVNGFAFYNAGNASSGFDGEFIQPNGIFIKDSKAILGWESTSNLSRNQAIICGKDGKLKPTYRADGKNAQDYVNEGAAWGYSWGGWCVKDGATVLVDQLIFGDPSSVANHSARTIIGQAANGDYIVIVAEGKSGEYGLSGQDCATVALQHGCVNAFVSDGGGSSQLWWGSFYALPSSDNGFISERTLAGGLGINCELSAYDSGWIDQELASGFTVNSGVGVRYRQSNNQINLEFSVAGAFSTTPKEVCAKSKPWRYMPTAGLITARGAAGGNGGAPAWWVMANNVTLATVAGNPSYIAGQASWATKHAASNTTS